MLGLALLNAEVDVVVISVELEAWMEIHEKRMTIKIRYLELWWTAITLKRDRNDRDSKKPGLGARPLIQSYSP